MCNTVLFTMAQNEFQRLRNKHTLCAVHWRHNVNHIWKNESTNMPIKNCLILHTHTRFKLKRAMVLGVRTSSFSSKSVRISGSNEFCSCCSCRRRRRFFSFLVMRQQLFFYPPYMAISIIHNTCERVCGFTIILYYIDSLCTPTSD